MKSPLFLFCMLPAYALCSVPSFVSSSYLTDPDFECGNHAYVAASEAEQANIDLLWKETLIYLEGYAKALMAPSTDSSCKYSQMAISETDTIDQRGPRRQCIASNVDVQKMVSHIYAILANADEAKKCFNPQRNDPNLFTPNSQVQSSSSVSTWIDRPLLTEYFAQLSFDDKLKERGLKFAQHFHHMITGESIMMPASAPIDISANALTHLWASVGWVPMYSTDDARAKNMGSEAIRGGYAYAEVFGPWGLLQIKKINGENVGAEIGMTVQAIDSFYPYHHHASSEIYYTIRKPKCVNTNKQFVINEHSPLIKVLEENNTTRRIEFDGSNVKNMNSYWRSTTPEFDPLLYIPANSLHAFDLTEHCESEPDEKAHIAVWARTNADRKENDYGQTRVCSLKDNTLDTKAINNKNAHVLCEKTIFKY